MASPKTVKILTIDGGGGRGYFSSCFFERFINQWGIGQEKIAENFDIISGTSAGGIQACGYANGLTAADSKLFFTEAAPWVFTIRTAADVLSGSKNASTPSNRPNIVEKISMLAISDPFYKAVDPLSNYGDARLKFELDAAFGITKLNNLKTNVVIPSFEQITYRPVIFSNVNLPDYIGADLYVKDVVLSTASAPIYFPPSFIDVGQYMDGAIFQNNPVLFAYQLGKILYPDAKRFCVLSIGTGLGDVGFHIPDGQPAPSGGIPLLFSLIGIEMVTAQEGNHKLMEYESTLEPTQLFYYRFQTILDRNQDTQLDNTDPAFFTYLEQKMNAQYDQDAFKIAQFISRLNDE